MTENRKIGVGNHGMPTGQSQLSVEEALELLVSSRRRRMLRYLLDQSETVVKQETLAEVIARDDPTDPATIEATLIHLHLPKCADVGVLEYDYRSGAVRLTEAAKDLKPLLDTVWEKWESPRD